MRRWLCVETVCLVAAASAHEWKSPKKGKKSPKKSTKKKTTKFCKLSRILHVWPLRSATYEWNIKSQPPLPAVVYSSKLVYFVAIRTRNFAYLANFGYFVAKLCTSWCTYTGLNNMVVYQNWKISGMGWKGSQVKRFYFEGQDISSFAYMSVLSLIQYHAGYIKIWHNYCRTLWRSDHEVGLSSPPPTHHHPPTLGVGDGHR